MEHLLLDYTKPPELAAVLDIPTLQALMDDFHALSGIASAIIDLRGEVLVASGWQDICTRFHRAHPETYRNCLESDIQLSSGVAPGTFKLYRCLNGLWDMATPLMVGGHQVGNLFIGQFWLAEEPLDVERFRAQARRCGFDEAAYLAALERVPRVRRERVQAIMSFYAKFAQLVSELSYSKTLLGQERLLLHTLFDTLPDQIYVKDRASRFVLANQVTARNTGVGDPAALVGLTDHDLFPPELARQYAADEQELLRTGQPLLHREEPLVDPEGRRHWFLTSKIPLRNERGEVIGLVGIGREITAQKQALQALQERERELSSILANLPGFVYRCANDRDWTMLFLSEGCREVTGYAPEDLVHNRKLSYNQIIHPDYREHLWQKWQQVLAAKGVFEDEYPILTAGGETRWVWERGRGIFSPEGQLLFLEGYITDVTQRKRAEEALRESEARFRELFHTMSSGVAVYEALDDGQDFRIVDFNPAAESMEGVRKAEILGKKLTEVFPGVEAFGLLDVLRRVWRTGQPELLPARLYRNGRHEGWRENRVYKLPSGQVVALFDDVTEERRLQEQLLHAQRMEGIGRLAGGVAHDFNNLLTAIRGYTELARMNIAALHPAQKDLAEVLKAADRAAKLTGQLLAFSRRQIISPKVLDLNDVVADVHKMLRRLIGEDIELVTIPAPEPAWAKVDTSQIQQALMNLAVNARDAMPQGGKLTIEIANVTLDEAYARNHAETVPGDYVLLSVSDTGTGMSDEVKAHLFEPFFTTKEPGKGTGLGLATVYGIVKQHGGNIWVYSELGQGTTFKIYLPRATEPGEAPAQEEEISAVSPGQGTVLLVEDEPLLCQMVARVLEGRGYTVLQASTGQEALRLAEEYPGEIRLLLTDVVMPQMSGPELAERLQASRPQLKVLYVSGYTENGIVHHGVLERGINFLPKPFTAMMLLAKIQKVLEGSDA